MRQHRKYARSAKSAAILNSSGDGVLNVDYFRPRDFEYVQPLYDLAFLLEVDALARKRDIPKYRTFSLWRAGYSLDGYGTTIDRWLDGTLGDDDLDYVPSARIREYLVHVRKSGSHPELRSYRGEKFARCLRLRSLRGIGPSQIAGLAEKRELSAADAIGLASASNTPELRVRALFQGPNEGPWQTAHLVPPLLRFVKLIEQGLGGELGWNVSGLIDPFEAVNRPVVVRASADAKDLESAIQKALKRDKFFRRIRAQDGVAKCFIHQMGWTFSFDIIDKSTSWKSVSELAEVLDPFVSVDRSRLKSDLHLHTAWSDGSASVNTMAKAVVANGLEFFAVTDHSRSSKLQNGLTPVLWLRQANALALAAPVCPVLHGIEVDILKDGKLDLPESLLAAADLVVASVHSSWSFNKLENTNRLLRAIESGCVDVLAHPTSAVVGKPGVPDYLRPPADVDWSIVFQACARWKVALEMNCFPSRLDLSLQLLKQAIDAGCAISIGSDAHARSHLSHLRFGEAALRRLSAPIVLNHFSYAELRSWVQDNRRHRKGMSKTIAIAQQRELQFEPAAEARVPKLLAHIQPPQALPSGSRVLGIDLTAGDKATGLAVVDGLAVETCSLTTDEEILEYVHQHKPKIVSIDSPLGLPGGGAMIDPAAGIMRVAEHDLASVGIPAYPSLIDSMEKLTLRGIRLRRAIEAMPRPPKVIESYPGAAQDILCIPRKQKSLELLREGLRRLGLQGSGLDTRSHDEMDAITSAIVGRYFEAGLFEPMGIPSESQLLVPKVPPLKFEQNPVICLAGKTGAGKSVVARYLSVFYGFSWIKTRNVIRELLVEDSTASADKRLWQRVVHPENIKENDLREFGALILDHYNQVPLRKHLMKMVKRCKASVVVDSIRDVADLSPAELDSRPMLIWFVDCADSIIRTRLAERKKLGMKRVSTGSPVDRTASEIRRHAHQIVPNSASLEELRWAVDDALFARLLLKETNANYI